MPKQSSNRKEGRTAEEILKDMPQWLVDAGADDILKKEFRYCVNHDRIGQLIRERRKKAGMSLRSMAKWMGISAPYLSDLEIGNRPWPQSRIEHATEILEMAERIKQSESNDTNENTAE